MYQRAKRLSALPLEGGYAVEILTAQCQSYLVAINVLELQASDKRYITISTEGESKQPKVSCRPLIVTAVMLTFWSTSGRRIVLWTPSPRILL